MTNDQRLTTSVRQSNKQPWAFVGHRSSVVGRSVVLLLVLLSCLALLPAQASAQSEQPDLEAYTALVREALAAAQRSDRLGLEQVAPRLIAVEQVRVGDERVSVDNRWLAAALDAPDPDLPAIAERLGAIVDVLAQPDSAAPADARQQLADLLSQPPFGEREPQTPNWLIDFLDWFGRLIDALFQPIGASSTSAGNLVGWVVGGIGALLLIGVILYLLLGLRRTIAAEARVANADPEANLTARTALDQAGDLARSGDHRTAMRYLYLSALLSLDERDLLRYDRALTNREYLERLREHEGLRARLAPVVETFDRVWYGHAPLDDAAFAAYRAQVEALRREA